METRTVAAGAVRLEVLEAGVGGRPFLLVHGFAGAKEDFAEHLDALAAEGWHCVAPDLRGHGRSDQPDDEAAYSLDLFASDLVALVDGLGWGRFVLLGHSMGGMVVQHLALAHEDRLEGLILMDTVHGPVAVDRGSAELGKQIVGEGGMTALIDAQRAAGPGPLDTPSHQRLLETRAGYRDFCDQKGLSSSAAMWLSMIDQMFDQADRLDALGGLSVPTLVIVGDEDGPFLGPSRSMAATIPEAQLIVIENAGHSPQFENPPAWYAALSGFLASVAADAVAG